MSIHLCCGCVEKRANDSLETWQSFLNESKHLHKKFHYKISVVARLTNEKSQPSSSQNVLFGHITLLLLVAAKPLLLPAHSLTLVFFCAPRVSSIKSNRKIFDPEFNSTKNCVRAVATRATTQNDYSGAHEFTYCAHAGHTAVENLKTLRVQTCHID